MIIPLTFAFHQKAITLVLHQLDIAVGTSIWLATTTAGKDVLGASQGVTTRPDIRQAIVKGTWEDGLTGSVFPKHASDI